MKTRTVILLFLFIYAKQAIAQTRATVFVFLSQSCPICQSYTLPLKELYKHYGKQNIRFVGIFPDSEATPKELNEFKKTYAIPFELLPDSAGTITKKFGATITPEVFVEDEAGRIIYSGRIDDSFYAVGKRRKVVTTHELADALESHIRGSVIKVSKTQAVGCLINPSDK